MAERNRPLYAVLIDADNISATHAGGILKEVTRFADPALRKVYGDWSSSALGSWKGEILKHGLVAHQETANTKGKNASDIGLVIDAMDILHGGRLDGFVLVSSDGDFTRLASRIREHGLDVVGMGMRKAPVSFVKACQKFIYLDNLDSSEFDTGEKPAASKTVEASRELSGHKKENPAKAVPLIKRAINKNNSEEEWISLSHLGSTIQADNPDFDARTYGKQKLSDLIKDLKEFKLKEFDGQLKARRAD